MNFDSRGENNLLRRTQTLSIGERFEEEFRCLANIRKRLFDRRALRLAPL